MSLPLLFSLLSSIPKSSLDYLARHSTDTTHLYINFTDFAYKFLKPVLALKAVKGNRSSVAQIAI